MRRWEPLVYVVAGMGVLPPVRKVDNDQVIVY